MTEKELQRLKRAELLGMLFNQIKENEELRQELVKKYREGGTEEAEVLVEERNSGDKRVEL